MKAKDTRSNDPIYLSYVQKYFSQVAEQLKGELWKDGGPVIGIQLENEYSRRGLGAGEDHIRKLKKIAVQDGLDVPIYTVTGWDNAVIPHGDFVAVFGGYPDAPWDASLSRLPPQEVYAFRFGSRVTGNMGAIGLSRDSSRGSERYDFPFMTAEMGGGVQDTYHRRPVIRPDDIAAMVPVMLGSGVNLYGSYMFQGGENPDGRLTTLQESQVTHYPADVPVKSYDFQAPLGEYGDERPVLRKLKVFSYFMQDFGSQLAPMETFAPSLVPAGPEDLGVARVAVRTNGKEGFLFFNNYVRDVAMPERKGFQVVVKLPSATLTLPDSPLSLPNGAYGIWPFNLPIGSSTLCYATAQLFTRTHERTETTYYFVETPGVPAEFVLTNSGGTQFKVHGGAQTRKAGKIFVRNLAPSFTDAITIQDHGNRIHIVLLSQTQAEDAWKLEAGETRHLFSTDNQFYASEDAIVLQSIGDPHFSFQVYPMMKFRSKALTSGPKRDVAVASYSTRTQARHPAVKVDQIAKADDVPPVRLGPTVSWRSTGVAMAPELSDFSHSAKWSIKLSPASWNGVEDLWLDIDYNGDVARLYSGGKLLVDNFYNGQIWHVGLKRYREQITKDGLELQILPRRKDAPIFLENPVSDKSTQVLDLRGITVQPEYELRLMSPPSQ